MREQLGILAGSKFYIEVNENTSPESLVKLVKVQLLNEIELWRQSKGPERCLEIWKAKPSLGSTSISSGIYLKSE